MIANTRQLFLKSIIINIFLFLCSSTIVNAQNNLGEAKVECPDTVNIGTTFSYSITIPVDSTFHETVLPPFDNANVEVLWDHRYHFLTIYQLLMERKPKLIAGHISIF